jgi:SAM-dependent methyltransferase
VTGDGTALPYADGSFDVVFSNSVIEHVGDFAKQEQFAREASRVGKALWIQTPAREFFIEPHLIAPFFHWLPAAWQKRVARRFTVWGLMTKPTPQQVHEFLGTIRLLTAAEMRALFPDCEIIVERFLGMPKSYVAVRRTALKPQAAQS